MSRAPATIHLGERKWSVRPLTLTQCEAVEVALALPAGTPTMTTGHAILAAALGRDHAADVAILGDLETTPREVARAMAIVLRQGGFVEAAAATGEAAAAAATDAPTGPGSAPA